MLKRLNGQWPILVFVLMFLTIPLSTLPGTGIFEFVFAILGLFAIVIAALVIASVVTSRRRDSAQIEIQDRDKEIQI